MHYEMYLEFSHTIVKLESGQLPKGQQYQKVCCKC